jgi:hypothetical protein
MEEKFEAKKKEIEEVAEREDGEKFIVTWEISDGFWKYFLFADGRVEEKYTENISIAVLCYLHPYFRHGIEVEGVKCFVYFEREREVGEKLHDKIAIWCLTDMLRRGSERNTKLIRCFCDVVREPLNEIIHLSNILANQYSREKMFMDMNSKVVSLADSIFDVIEIVKLDNGDMEMEIGVVDIESVVDNLRRLRPDRNIEVYSDSTVPEFISGNASRLQQILLNLVDTELGGSEGLQLIVESQALFCDETLQYEISFKLYDSKVEREDSFAPIELVDDSSVLGIDYIKRRLSYLLAKKMGGNLSSDETGKKLVITTNSVSRPIVNINTMDMLRGKKCLFICDDSVKIIFCKIMEKYAVEYFLAKSLDEALLLYGNKVFDFLLFRGTKASACDAVRLKHWKSPIVGVMDRDVFIPSDVFQHSILTYTSQLFKSVMIDVVNRTNLLAPILVATDDGRSRELVEMYLRDNGYKDITVVEDKRSAVVEMKRKRFFIALISFDQWNKQLIGEAKKWAAHPKMIGINISEEDEALFDQQIKIDKIEALDGKIKKLLGYV